MIKSALVILTGFTFAACGTLQKESTTSNTKPAQLSAAVGANIKQCEALAQQFNYAQTKITAATPVAAGKLTAAGQTTAYTVPSHCLLTGNMHMRKGADGRDYAIGFEMRLPTAWNGRFFYQGNGGLDGVVQPALGALGGGPLTGALAQGFAVISSDAGHTGAQTAVFGAEAQARLDYGYQTVGKLTPMAKALIGAAYGKAPDRSYIGGCSNGGRHTMVAAARFGEHYDGYLAGAPGYRLPNSALAQLWGAQQYKKLATEGATIAHPMNPNAPRLADLSSAFTAAERQTVAHAILEKCDALDGLKDGMVQATQACQTAFNLERDVPTCANNQRMANGQCLSAAQKQMVASIFAGTSKNQQALYANFAYDPGVAGANWATWKFVNSLALDPLAVSQVFSVPPTSVDPLNIDVFERLSLINAVNQTYAESGMTLMTPPQHEQPSNLNALRARGAKIMLYHGVSDAIFSSEDTRAWWQRVNQAQNGDAANFARYFDVPGMNHCSAGPAADQFDMLTPLVKWVEQGIAPDSVVASVRGAGNAAAVNPELPKAWSVNRTRLLCAHPKVAHYVGGNTENAASFQCK